ncbi:unnamed protein product [Phytophthora fragariaefolia]|uniref:Unnamed protein product n=1 Tax=Phytophthora fragariaefolia TaxID=1490495 RepID=A0A9W7DCK8_9STRA|nr:unnamed protein product [Phytophthora fragariaefolia]
MDFVTPQPKTRRGNTSLLLLFQCSFMDYVSAKATSSTEAQDIAEVFEEYVFRRFGALMMIRRDRDPRFMSETFKAFAELIQARSRATLSYRPRANGKQERSVKPIVQTVNVYVEDPLQQDWDDIAEKMADAINNSMATTEKIRLSISLTDAAAWIREANRQHEVALAIAKPYQAAAKARRAKEHNEAFGRLERMAVPIGERSDPTEVGDSTSDPTYRPLFEPGSRVWLFMELVKPGLTKKIAHRWHGPFCIKRKVEEFAYQLELPDKAGYRFYPVVHVSRLKPVRGDNRRPTAELVDELGEDDRFDFDEELLPEGSWEPEAGDDEYVVEAILDIDGQFQPVPNETSANSTSSGGATMTQLGNQYRIYRVEDCYSAISCSASARTVSRWFRLPMKVSKYARYPSVMGTGHRAWEKATLPHDDLAEGGHRPSPRPEKDVIRMSYRYGKPPQTSWLVVINTVGLGDPICSPKEPWKVHWLAEWDRRIETDLRVDQGSWQAINLIGYRSHHSIAQHIDSQAQEVRPLLPPKPVVLQGFTQRRELVVNPACSFTDEEGLGEPHIHARHDDPVHALPECEKHAFPDNSTKLA